MVKLLFLTSLVCVYAMESCQPGHRELFGTSCYELLTGTKTWQDTRDDCSAMGGKMAVPDTPEEHAGIWKMFTEKIAVTLEGELWIGCEENKTDGRWVQAGLGDYECVYLEWASNQPSNHAKEHCVEMRSQFDGKLNDRQCDELNYGMCEFNVITGTTTLPHRASSSPVLFCLEADDDGYFKSPRA
ncbi:tetranectin-like protein [Asterias amurensis]|uniref:tetranectin-like protein n=1 Tax=Asterias amurensis TaxID=7602 RepID=UPI003AB80D18